MGTEIIPAPGDATAPIDSEEPRMLGRRSFLLSTATALATRPRISLGSAAATYRPVLLKGDYTHFTQVSNKERQALAKSEGCAAVVEFHFNSTGNPGVAGGEVYYQEKVPASREFAAVIWGKIKGIGLPEHGDPLKSTAINPRTVFIDFYEMPTVLLETLFLSNPDQAAWLHGDDGPKHMEALADAIAAGIRAYLPEGGTIGLSPGHAFKTSNPNDTGARCKGGDHEADHTVVLAGLVEARLK